MPDHIYHYTYEIKNKTTGQMYIGLRSCSCNPANDNYYSSSITLNRRIVEEGIENFDKKILQLFPTREDASQHEIDLQELYDVSKNPMFYNKAKSTSTWFHCDWTGRKHSEETKKKLSNYKPWLGKRHTEESKQKQSEARKKQGNFRDGFKHSDETKRKISEGMKGNTNLLGKKLSEETKRKMSISSKGQIPWNKGKKRRPL